MAKAFPVTIYHNPKCSTSKQVLEMIEATGRKPEVVEYLKTGWTKPQLKELFAAAGLTPRQALRTKAREAEQLGLLDAKVSDAKILDAMIEHPVLVERPIVVTPKGARLARPKETVREIL
ncbi:MAG TPA: arsenate reductase (glutaredoxin) [Candidatus Binatia bacterium]|nr:arsenate reductase (glutaredoxin) [Candidatus Binatia bacterium]